MSRYLLMLLMLFSSVTYAVIETYEFDDDIKRERYHQFVDELRCPKCQNQNLAGSNSPIAKDLRRELHRLLEEGRSDQQVVEYMVDRYGDFILYRPRFNPETALLWLAPLIFLVAGLVIAITVYRRQRASVATDDSLSSEEQQQLKQLLNSTAGKDNSNA